MTAKERSKASKAGTRSSGAVVDPRLRARRIEVQRDAGRRRLRALIGLIVVTVIAGGAVVVSQSSLADVDAVVVQGAQLSDPHDVVVASGITVGEPLIDLDPDAVVAHVEALPWVLGATVERRMNGDVVVTIEERTPRAVLSTVDGGFVLVDEHGRQLERVAGRAPDYLPIAGIVASGEVGQPAPPETSAVVSVLDHLTPAVSAVVTQIVIDEGTLYLELSPSGRVKLGDDSSLDAKIVSLETMLSHADLRCLWEIDVRVPSAPALTRLSAAGDPRATLTDLAECT
ncbi:MAG: FtsQ-type POTRA domain-containing protein [Acidimicrobiales bacterium]